MLETIYTIPVNEAFDASLNDTPKRCPFCRLYEMLGKNELERILGAAMMDPDVRIRTNELGFCRRHFDKMYTAPNRLSFGLILESHLASIEEDMKKSIGDLVLGSGAKAGKKLKTLEGSCYVCDRIEASFSKMIDNAVYLWDSDGDFKKKVAAEPFYCLPHFRRFIESGKDQLASKQYKLFYDSVYKVTAGYLSELSGDVSWFCKKFDYRYENEPWGNSKDSIERAVTFISGEE